MCKKQGTFMGQLKDSIKGTGTTISGPDKSKVGRMIVLSFVTQGSTCLGVVGSTLITCTFSATEYQQVLSWLKAKKPVNINGVLVGNTLDPAYWELA